MLLIPALNSCTAKPHSMAHAAESVFLPWDILGVCGITHPPTIIPASEVDTRAITRCFENRAEMPCTSWRYCPSAHLTSHWYSSCNMLLGFFFVRGDTKARPKQSVKSGTGVWCSLVHRLRQSSSRALYHNSTETSQTQ
jgi:hypothetical protein